MKVLERKGNEEQTQKDFKKVIWIYDFWSGLTETKAIKKVLELAMIKNGDKVLDVACGMGSLLKEIVIINPDGKNIGIDLSPDMLDKARKKLSHINIDNVELLNGKATNLDFPDDSFDVVVNSYLVDLMPVAQFDLVASEFYRVLKNEGTAVIATFSFGTKRIHRFWYWVAKKFPQLLTGCRPVSFKTNLINAGFEIETNLQISQNTFPSEIIKVRKIGKPAGK